MRVLAKRLSGDRVLEAAGSLQRTWRTLSERPMSVHIGVSAQLWARTPAPFPTPPTNSPQSWSTVGSSIIYL